MQAWKNQNRVIKHTLDQKALLAQDQVIYLQDVYKSPEAFSRIARKCPYFGKLLELLLKFGFSFSKIK
jgi:hypothetical protein